MVTYFSIGKFRRLDQTGFVHYTMPTKHPERTFPVYHDIVYMDCGRWNITCGDEDYDVFKGDVFVLPAGIPHYSKCPCIAGTKTFFIHMLPVTGDNIGGEPPADGIARLPISTLIHCQSNNIIRSLFEEIWLLSTTDKPEEDEMLSAMLQTLLSMLYQCDSVGTSHSFDIISKCIDIMKDEQNVIFKEADMAKRLFVSGKTLLRILCADSAKLFTRICAEESTDWRK